ncbi:MAG TPA: CHRD domain-containing protein [Ktedonobacterales bacterium]
MYQHFPRIPRLPRHRLAARVGLAALTLALMLGVITALAGAAYPTSGYAAFTALRKAPTGSTQLTWSPTNHRLTVRLWMTGLAPNSRHPAHIHTGSCARTGGVLYTLPTVYANSAGNAAYTTTLYNVRKGIPRSGWSINVHNGPNLSPAVQFQPIACGNIYNVNPSTRVTQRVRVSLGAASDANQHAWGSTSMWISGRNLVVRVRVGGLAPYSAHAAHIHKGSCARQGGVVYMLKNVVANASGYADGTTVIKGVRTIPRSGWYVNVHRSSNISTQTGFDPIACGNIYAR